MVDQLAFPPSLEAAVAAFDPTLPLDLHDVGNALAAVRATFAPGNPLNYEAWLETIPFNLSIEGEGQEPFHSYFAPISSQTYEDGRVIFFPDPREADARALSLWGHRRDSVKHPVLVARYADILWDLSYPIARVKSDRRNAEIAVTAYVAAVNADLYSSSFERAASAIRAVSLACSLRSASLVKSATETLLAITESAEGEPRYLDVIGVLLWNPRLGLDEVQRDAIVQRLQQRLATLTDPLLRAFEPFEAKDVADVLGRHYRRMEQGEAGSKAFRSVGIAFDHVAALSNPMQAAAHLDIALEAYMKAGDREAIERVRVAKAEAIKGSVAQMTTHEFRNEISQEQVDTFLSAIIVDDTGWSFALVAAKFVDNVTHLKARVKAEAKAAPIQAVITMQIMEDEHVSAIIGSVDDDLEGRVVQAAERSFAFDELFLGLALERLMEVHSLTTIDLIAWANRLDAFPNSYLLRAGVEAWDKGDWPKALHLLVFQIEAALRNILRQTGGAIVKSHPQGGGREVLLSMNEVLGTNQMRNALGEDLLLYFRAAYCDPRGANLRNVVGHGITKLGHVDRATCNRLIHSLLVLGCWRDIAASRKDLEHDATS